MLSWRLQHEERREVVDGREAVAATGRDGRGERLGMEYRAPTRLCLGLSPTSAATNRVGRRKGRRK
jgi:hypothetical protein